MPQLIWTPEALAGARNAALEAIESEGAIAFMRGDNVVPFPGS